MMGITGFNSPFEPRYKSMVSTKCNMCAGIRPRWALRIRETRSVTRSEPLSLRPTESAWIEDKAAVSAEAGSRAASLRICHS
jgi:hypothetical protein